MNKHWILCFLLASFQVYAEPCKITMPDLAEAIQANHQGKVISQSGLTDPYSQEPIKRYMQAQADGAVVIIEQKHCLMYNVTITLLLPEGLSINSAPQKLGAALQKTEVWRKWFASSKAEALLQREFSSGRFATHSKQAKGFAYSLDDLITLRQENSEVTLQVDKLAGSLFPFPTIISLYLGVGGM